MPSNLHSAHTSTSMGSGRAGVARADVAGRSPGFVISLCVNGVTGKSEGGKKGGHAGLCHNKQRRLRGWNSEWLLLRLPLLLGSGTAAASRGNPACWHAKSGFDFDHCCDVAVHGPSGNRDCWDGIHTYTNCCLDSNWSTDLVKTDSDDVFNSLMERGRTGDSAVLPNLIKFLSAGGVSSCNEAIGPVVDHPELRCVGTPRGVSKKTWESFFETQSLLKYMRMQKLPEEGDPWLIFKACCLGPDADEVLELMASDCVFGVATLLLTVLSHIDHALGPFQARRLHQKAKGLIEGHSSLQQLDCRWQQQVNHASFQHFDWFLEETSTQTDSPRFPCNSMLRIFVDEDETSPIDALRARPLWCASRGLCFTEVWLHQFLRHSACRAQTLAEADFHFQPAYTSCYDLHAPETAEHSAGVDALLANLDGKQRGTARTAIDARASAAREARTSVGPITAKSHQRLPPLLLLMTCEKWKLRGLHERQRWAKGNATRRPRGRHSRVSSRSRDVLIAAVEAKPLLQMPETRFSAHCEDCFNTVQDVVVPSAVLPTDAWRLRFFDRQPKDRDFVVVWHGEHANSKSRDDVAEGYREVNETVRLAIIESLATRPHTSIGSPSMRYGFLMGNTHFCLIPRGRGWWTVRLFEAFYSGCVPVILSDGQALPFESFLNWETFSLKWPMQRVKDGLYEHLLSIVEANDGRLASLHAGVRKVACWFDYHAPENGNCSPYLGLLRQLELRKTQQQQYGGEDQPLWSEGTTPVRRYWF
eukprot:TRINITY_DN70438_c0_g1_i1.p1 TRINITY_DN70438_c0_g1~~TRINITY_DN70438_c0_g1_i1.p1  ORF type:complete len:759 (+),score=108.71 TRINITY_DN70438_c0_g1_i1:180-2456(+)